MKNANQERYMRLLFLEYLIRNVFDNSNVKNILEVGSSVENSASLLLPRFKYKQFLLSTKVELIELQRNQIDGAKGVIFKGNMHHLANYNDIPSEQNKIVNGPNIKEFDTLLSIGWGNEHRHAIYSLNNIKKFIGQCVSYEKDSDINFYDNLYHSEYECMNAEYGGGHTLVSEINLKEKRGYYLIMKKQI